MKSDLCVLPHPPPCVSLAARLLGSTRPSQVPYVIREVFISLWKVGFPVTLKGDDQVWTRHTGGQVIFTWLLHNWGLRWSNPENWPWMDIGMTSRCDFGEEKRQRHHYSECYSKHHKNILLISKNTVLFKSFFGFSWPPEANDMWPHQQQKPQWAKNNLLMSIQTNANVL